MARFIVGTTIRIQPIASWTDHGTIRTPRSIPRDLPVIALDPKDAMEYKFEADGVFLLYENLPVPDAERNMMSYDPSILPFLSQRLLIVLSRMSPDNYSFYQRRLAEFQSRLESTLEVGRSLIGEANILDLTGSISPWVRAAASNSVRPPNDLWNAWTGNTRTPELAIAIEEAARRDWWILYDAWTPASIKSLIPQSQKNIAIPPPDVDYDFFTYLHDIYLEIWSARGRR